jgi:hypothetical protein
MKLRLFSAGGILLLAAGLCQAQDVDTSFDEPAQRPDDTIVVVDLPEPSLAPEPAALAFAHIPDTETELDPGDEGAAGPAIDRSAGGEDGSGDAGSPAALPEPALPEPVVEVVITADDIQADRRWPQAARSTGGVIADRQIIAYYGHPRSRYMGVLGESPIEEMAASLLERAAEYDELNGDIGVAPAFHIIYGTVYEDGSVGILREPKLMEYLNYAADHGILVFLDHQIGNGTVHDAITQMLPYLRYEHVHLAIDPEWATPIPGREIGQVSAADINEAQQLIEDYVIENDLPGNRMLVVHQFNWRMITNRENVRSDFSRVQLIHNADGFGPPAEKYVSWEFNVQAVNLPLKGFKLFFPKTWRDGGYDEPLLTPAEVLQLDPVPVYVQYQ